VRDSDKAACVAIARDLIELGFDILATRGTATLLVGEGVPVTRVNKVLEGRPHIVDSMLSGLVQLVVNTVEGAQATADSFSLRRAALTNGISYYTTIAGARAAVLAIRALRSERLEATPLQSYLGRSF
jgi:carbamoyl-phosphate synthase large subunit